MPFSHGIQQSPPSILLTPWLTIIILFDDMRNSFVIWTMAWRTLAIRADVIYNDSALSHILTNSRTTAVPIEGSNPPHHNDKESLKNTTFHKELDLPIPCRELIFPYQSPDCLGERNASDTSCVLSQAPRKTFSSLQVYPHTKQERTLV